MGRAQNTVKRGTFRRGGEVGGWGGGPSLLRRGEKRHGQGAPGRILRLTPLVGSAGFLDPPFHRSVGLKAFGWGPASEI